jgi:hypothetical protein
MSRNIDWRSYVNDLGDFELPNYLYKINNDLMKQYLDLGTLLSDDNNKLRAYKEQVKKVFKKRWLETAQALEFFDLIIACTCGSSGYCDICGGSRYLLNSSVSPDQMREIGIIMGAESTADLADKLQKGLVQALNDIQKHP